MEFDVYFKHEMDLRLVIIWVICYVYNIIIGE